MRFLNIGSPKTIPEIQSSCLKCLVQNVIGDNNTNGLNTRAIFDNTDRFVRELDEGWPLKKKVSIDRSHFRPKTFISGCSLMSYYMDGDIALACSDTPSRILVLLLAYFLSSNFPNESNFISCNWH